MVCVLCVLISGDERVQGKLCGCGPKEDVCIPLLEFRVVNVFKENVDSELSGVCV